MRGRIAKIPHPDTDRRSRDMPYATNEDLPPALRRNLPTHALDICREAFNHVWRHHGDDRERREEIAHRVAWSAVKKRYRKRDGLWTAIQSP